MGACASNEKEPQQDGPAPVKAPASATTTSTPAGVAKSTEAPRASPASTGSQQKAAADGSAEPAKSKPGELKGAARYEISPGSLGKGHFAVVKKCRDVVTGAIYAVKIIDKKEMVKSSASVVKQEIEILKAVGSHPNIVQLVDHYEDNSKHYLIMELCLGGDLFSQIVEHGKYSEAEAAVSCKQLADALRHIHSCGITHRDLKPENILLVRADPSSPLKLADFGLSKLIKGHLHPMRTVCGTWAYCVSGETKLREVLPSGKQRPVEARMVTKDTVLVDELYRPVRVKAIHTTARNVEKLWTVMDRVSGDILFRCTPDHKLSLLETLPGSQLHKRVEIRCAKFAALSSEEQSRFVGYTASPIANGSATSLKHVGRTFPLMLLSPLPTAAFEPYYGIEVASATHRYMLDSEVVTSNCAPEVIKRKPYDSSVDNWTLGVLMYILLSGYHPFDVYGEMPEPELLQKIITCSYDFDDPVWVNISQSAKDLIKGLLQLDPSKRLTLDYYLSSPWITNGNESSDTNNNLVVERLSKFGVGKTKFRAVAKTILDANKVKRQQAGGDTGTPNANGEADSSGASSSNPQDQTQAAGASGGLEPVRETTLGDIIGSAGLGLGLGEHEPSSSDNGDASGHHKNAVSVNQIDASAGTLTTNRSERGGSVDGEEDETFPTHSSGASSGPTIHAESPAMAARPLEATS